MADKRTLSTSDYKCSICLELLIEPVELPCKHELCRPCFRQNVEEANFECPICRRRISNWARKCNREGTLVNQKRWNLIQKLFPERCLKRMKGEADESEDELPLKRVLAESGELRQEYEKEMNKLSEEKEKEQKASEELIKVLLEEEQTIQSQQEIQQKNDEMFAKRIAEELEKQIQNHGEGSSGTNTGLSISTSKEKNKDTTNKRKKSSNEKSPYACHTLDKYFSLQLRTKDCTTGNDNVFQDKENNMDKDFELAKALQKQFDKEAMISGKREEYMLRKTLGNENTVEPSDNDKDVCLSST